MYKVDNYCYLPLASSLHFERLLFTYKFYFLVCSKAFCKSKMAVSLDFISNNIFSFYLSLNVDSLSSSCLIFALVVFKVLISSNNKSSLSFHYLFILRSSSSQSFLDSSSWLAFTYDYYLYAFKSDLSLVIVMLLSLIT